jgi:hypothetical protein
MEMQDFNGLKDALEYVVENIRPHEAKTFEIDGHVYSTDELVHICEKTPPEYRVAALEIASLQGFIDYIKANTDGIDLSKTLAIVTSAKSVALMSVPYGIKNQRDIYLKSNAIIPDIPFGGYRSIEEFIVCLQSQFVESPDRETLLKYIGNIKEDESVTTTDDGVSQRIVAHTGVASVDAVILPNPVKLRPYRTFQELEQPETEFILRVRKGGQVALFEADGGTWRVKCRALIKKALQEALCDIEGICVIG